MINRFALTVLLVAGCDNTLLDHDSDKKTDGPGGRLSDRVGGTGAGDGPGIGGVTLPKGPNLPPIAGGTMLLTSDPNLVAVSDPDQDAVWIANVRDRLLLGTVDLEPGDEPGRIAEGPDRKLQVVLRRSGKIATIDLGGRRVVRRHEVCPAPRGIDYDDTTNKLWVACRSGQLLALDGDGQVVEDIKLPDDLRDVVADNDVLYVSRFRQAVVFRLDANRQRTVEMLDAPVGFTPSVAWRMRAHPEGGVMVLHQASRDSPIPVSTTAMNTQGVSYGQSQPQACQSPIIRQVVTFIDVPNDSRLQNLDRGVLGVDAAVSTDGTQVAVAMAGSIHSREGLNIYDPLDATGNCNALSGSAPPPMTSEVIAVEFSDAHGFLFVERNPPSIRDLAGGTTDLDNRSGGTREDVGHSLFHKDAGGGIACASCHPEGADDGRTWIFPDFGPRRTQSLRTAIEAPFHWAGDMKSFQDLAREVFTGRMGGRQLGVEETAYFEDYIRSIPPYPRKVVTDPHAVGRGQELFASQDVGCVNCHSGSDLSNGRTMFVGTGEALQVPSLIGVAARLPLMHDGCADTLQARFDPDCGGGDSHGRTSHLSTAQIDDLVAYLEQL